MVSIDETRPENNKIRYRDHNVYPRRDKYGNLKDYTYRDIIYLRQSRYHYRKYGIFMWRTRDSYLEYNKYLQNYINYSHFAPDHSISCYIQAKKVFEIINYPICISTELAYTIVNNNAYEDIHKSCKHKDKECLIVDEYIKRLNNSTNEKEWVDGGNGVIDSFDRIKKYNRSCYMHGNEIYFEDLPILPTDKLLDENIGVPSIQYFYNFLKHKKFDWSDWGDGTNGILHDVEREDNYRLVGYYGTSEDIEYFKTSSENYETHGIWNQDINEKSVWIEDDFHTKSYYGPEDMAPIHGLECGISSAEKIKRIDYLRSIGQKDDEDEDWANAEFQVGD